MTELGFSDLRGIQDVDGFYKVAEVLPKPQWQDVNCAGKTLVQQPVPPFTGFPVGTLLHRLWETCDHIWRTDAQKQCFDFLERLVA